MLNLLDPHLERGRVINRALASTCECPHPRIHSRSGGLSRGWPAIPGSREAIEVILGPGRQHQGNGWEHTRGKTSAPQYELDQPSSGPAVTIGKRVDGLELGVRDRSLGDGWQ